MSSWIAQSFQSDASGEWSFPRAKISLSRAGVEYTLKRQGAELAREEDVKVFLGSKETLQITPVPLFSQDPIVIKLKYPITVPPHCSSQWWVPLPIDLGFQFGDSPVDQNLRLPIRRMSLTWFGTTTDGQRALSFPLKTLSHEECEPQEDEFLLALSLMNQWKKWIVVDRILIPIESLHLYRQQNRWVSDGLSYLYRGKPGQCRVSYHGTPFSIGQKKILDPQKVLEYHAVRRCLSEKIL